MPRFLLVSMRARTIALGVGGSSTSESQNNRLIGASRRRIASHSREGVPCLQRM